MSPEQDIGRLLELREEPPAPERPARVSRLAAAAAILGLSSPVTTALFLSLGGATASEVFLFAPFVLCAAAILLAAAAAIRILFDRTRTVRGCGWALAGMAVAGLTLAGYVYLLARAVENMLNWGGSW